MKSKSRKLSLIGTIFVSMLSVCSAGVSTFAWFQAQANVNITTSSTSTMISVSRPDDYSFYAYKGNRNSSHILQNNFTNDFTLIDDSTKLAEETELSNFNPGDIKTYCLVMNGHDASKNVDLSITQITSNDALKQYSKNRFVYESGGSESSTQINVGWAINIYTSYDTTNSSLGYSSFVNSRTGRDRFDYTNGSTILDGTTTGNIITLTRPISIFNQSISSSTVYLYYSIVFTNDSSIFYREVDATGKAVLEPNKDENDRYFEQSANGNSNCYELLTFALNTLTLTF